MKNSTFSAQVANNLLTLLQGYSKTIRLLLVMLLTLTVTTNAWAADVTLSSSTITSGKKLAYTSEWTYTANNVSWSGYCYTDANNRPWIQLKKDKGVYVKIVTPSGSKITQLKVTITSGTNSSGGVADITKHTDFSGRVALLTEDTAGSTSMTGVAYTTTVSNDIATLNPSGNNNTLYLKVSGGARIWSMTVTYETSGGGSTPDPITVTLDKSTLSLEEGENATLTATVTGSTKAVTWTSDASNIASVDNAGKVTAIAAGTANITAAIGDVKATCKVTVTAATTPDPGTGGEETTVTYILKDDPNHPANSNDWFNGTIDQYTSWTATKGGTNNPKYYDTGSGLRIYNGGKFTITSSKVMLSITLTFSSGSYTFSADNTTNPQTVTPNAKSYEWSVSRTCRLQKIEITYAADGGDDPDPVDPEVTFSNGEYTVGGAALDLSTLLKTNSTGAVTYSVKTDGGTEATINGTSFTATAEGTCTVQASIDATATYNAATATATITVTAPATVEGTWTLVTNATNLKAGDEIVIASNTKGKVAAALTDDYLGEYGVSFSNDKNTITALPATALVFTLGGSAESWTLTNDEKSLGATAVKKLAWDKGTTTWSISIEEGNATIQNATDTYGRFLHNVQSTRFTTYTSDASANMLLPQIYKKAGNTPDPIKLATPENLGVSSVTASSATLTWHEVANASGYIVNLEGNEHETNTNSLTLNDLTASTTYKWTVKAKGDGINYSDSENSSQSSFTTDAATYTITYVTNEGTKVESTSGTALPDPLPTTTRDHYTFAGWFTDEGCTQAATAGATINANTTLYAKWTPITYTVTFDAGSGTCGTTTMTGNFETGITLPTATPCDYASTSGWIFVGWSESTVSETTVRPAIHTGNYKPTKDIKLHAVYAKTGTAEGAAGEFILSLEYEGTTYYVGQTFDNNKLSAETEQTNAARFTIEDNYLHYEGGYISHVATQSSTNITREANKEDAQAWTIAENGNTITFTSTADATRGLGFNFNKGGTPRFAAYQLSNADYPHTFTKTSVSGGNIQVTTYNSKPSCEAPVDPNWVAATITHTAIKANCGSTTVPSTEGENGPATISFSGTYLQNSVTVTASDGFLVSINKTNDAAYSNTVTVNPVASGENQGKITQNVHVIADATAKNESYTGTITLTGNDITDGEQVIDVTAAVTCTQYTITWSVNGDDSHQVTYSPGDALQLPSIPVTPCDGMEHVGWTDNMGYVHETDILFTETTDMTVTGNQTYYAVFATPTSSDGGETTLNFSKQGYSNGEAVTSLTSDGVTVEFDKGSGSTAPAYYDSGSAVRVYANGTFTVSSGNTISQIVITFGTSDKTNEITTNKGTYSEGTWTGSENSVIFTVGGTKDHRRIQSITVTSAGSGASYYTGHTTTCSGSQQLATPTNLQATDITYKGATLTWDAVAGANKYKVVINGTEYISNTNSYTTHALKQQTAYTWTVQAIGNGTTFTDSEISAEDTFTTGTELEITWSVSTITSTTTITKGQPIGANLKTPATPAGCEGKVFMGWSASSTVKSDGSDFTPITSATVPETNVTYYAVFAEPTGNGGAQGEPLFSESFDSMDGKGGNDGEWSGNIATAKLESFDYWTLSSVYKASACIKLGTGSLAGSATTPALGINGNATLTFDAGAWNGSSEKLIINLTIVGDGSIEPSSVTLTKGQFNTYTANITGANADTKVQFIAANAANNRFFLDEVKVSGGSSDSYTDYSTSCGTYTVTFYGFNSGEYTTTCNDNPAEIAVAQGGSYTIPDCTPTTDPQGLGRTFAGTWNTQANGKGTAYEPGDEFIVNSNITLYAQWALNTSENITLPTDVEDLATTDVVVTGGKTLTIPEGETITINSLTLKGGLLGANSESGYAMPSVVIPEGATLVRKNTTINLDLVVNSDSWYPFAVPFAVANNSNIDYLDPVLKAASTYNTHFAIKTYDGENRAKVGTDQKNNWDKVLQTAGLQPGKGYIISAMTYPDKDTATIRIPMSVSNDWLANGELTTVNEVTRNTVAVIAYTGDAATEHQRHAGWNFVANPYLANFAGTNASGSFINGEIIINKGDYSYGGEDVPYVTIPTYNFAHYYQVKLSDATLSPAYSFFVQVGTDGTMTFETAGRQQAPASIAARNAEERPVKMDVDITLSDNHSSDQTGIIISDRYNDTYEIGRDLEKLFGSAYNLSVYTLMADNTPLAFQALAIRSNMQVIPVGYRAPEQGEYTFRLNEATSSIDLLNEQYEQLVLVDYQTGELTNLLISDYTFYSERVQSDSRFALYAVPRQNAPTDLPNALGSGSDTQKVLHNGHLYILHNGSVYNGNGQIVK